MRWVHCLAAGAWLVAASPVAAQPAARQYAPLEFQLLFDSDSSIPLSAQREIIPDTIALNLAPQMDRGIRLFGHADRAGTRAHNQALSCRRAQWLRHALIARGVSPDRIILSAYGEDYPLVETADGMPEGANRRVETILTPRWSQVSGSYRHEQAGC